MDASGGAPAATSTPRSSGACTTSDVVSSCSSAQDPGVVLWCGGKGGEGEAERGDEMHESVQTRRNQASAARGAGCSSTTNACKLPPDPSQLLIGKGRIGGLGRGAPPLLFVVKLPPPFARHHHVLKLTLRHAARQRGGQQGARQ